MGVDTRLYLSMRWDVYDIQAVLTKVLGQEPKIKVYDNIPSMITFEDKDVRIDLHIASTSPIGALHCLSARANIDNCENFREIANVLGGLYEESDCGGQLEMIYGKMDEGNELPYFIKYAITRDNIKPDDLTALKKSIKQWAVKVNHSHDIKGLD